MLKEILMKLFIKTFTLITLLRQKLLKVIKNLFNQHNIKCYYEYFLTKFFAEFLKF